MKKTFYLILIFLLHSIVNTAQIKENPKIGLVYTSPHPVINQIIAGFKSVIKDTFPNAIIIEKHANGRQDEYENAVSKCLEQNPDVLVPITTPISILTINKVQGRIPVVFMGVTDPIGAKIVLNYNKPTISTGSCDRCPFESLLELARRLYPSAKTLGLPYNPKDPPAVFGKKMLDSISPQYGFKIISKQVESQSELSTIVQTLASVSDIIIISSDNLMMENPSSIATAALNAGKPTIACDRSSVRLGAVAGVSVDYNLVGEKAAYQVIKVLRGAKVGDIPVAILNNKDIIINKEAACNVGLILDSLILTESKEIVNQDYICKEKEGNHLLILLGGFIILILLISFTIRRIRK